MDEIFRKITADQIGRDAVKESIKMIPLTQGNDANISNFTRQNGTLEMP